MSPDEESLIRDLISQINTAWLEGRPRALEAWFHPAIVIAPPGFGDRVVGRDQAIASYEDFVARAKVIEYAPGEPTIDRWHETAVATSPFQMTYELGGQTYREAGHDVLVFGRHGDRWLVVWRTLVAAVN